MFLRRLGLLSPVCFTYIFICFSHVQFVHKNTQDKWRHRSRDHNAQQSKIASRNLSLLSNPVSPLVIVILERSPPDQRRGGGGRIVARDWRETSTQRIWTAERRVNHGWQSSVLQLLLLLLLLTARRKILHYVLVVWRAAVDMARAHAVHGRRGKDRPGTTEPV